MTGCGIVNNAGYGAAKNILEATPESLEAEFGINVFGPIYLTQAVVGIGKMPRGGRIINVGSIASKLGPEISAVYGATKAAQDSLTASWAGQVSFSSVYQDPPNHQDRLFLMTSNSSAVAMELP